MLYMPACKSLFIKPHFICSLYVLPVTPHFSTQIFFYFYFLLSLFTPAPVFSSELHPYLRAPSFLHPLHRIDCNSGLDLVLVGGAGVLRGPGMAMALLLSAAEISWKSTTTQTPFIQLAAADFKWNLILNTFFLLISAHLLCSAKAALTWWVMCLRKWLWTNVIISQLIEVLCITGKPHVLFTKEELVKNNNNLSCSS